MNKKQKKEEEEKKRGWGEGGGRSMHEDSGMLKAYLATFYSSFVSICWQLGDLEMSFVVVVFFPQ